VFFIWYGAVRFAVESLKADNWRIFGVPTAQIVAAITVLGAAAILAVRHARSSGMGPPAAAEEPQSRPGE
jgi:prolipoprotein diacylglyceryltransferase